MHKQTSYVLARVFLEYSKEKGSRCSTHFGTLRALFYGYCEEEELSAHTRSATVQAHSSSLHGIMQR